MQDFSLDRLHNVNARNVGRAAMAVLDHIQLTYSPEEQAAGVGVILTLLRDRYGFDMSQALKVSENLIDRAGHNMPEIRAARTYVENEL